MHRRFCAAALPLIFILFAGCRTIPQNPSEMTCADLEYLADEAAEQSGLPFFATQLKYPGDWRPYGPNNWFKQGSRVRVRENKKDFFQAEVLSISGPLMEQTPYRVRIPVSQCQNAIKTPQGTMEFRNLLIDSPKKISQPVVFDFKGKEPVDYLARLVCGFQPAPAIDKTQTMAQKWQKCTARGSKAEP